MGVSERQYAVVSTRDKVSEAKRWLDMAWDELQVADPFAESNKFIRARRMLDAKLALTQALRHWPKADDYSKR